MDWDSVVKLEKEKKDKIQKEYEENHPGVHAIKNIQESEVINKEFYDYIKEAVICQKCGKISAELYVCQESQYNFCPGCREVHEIFCEKCKKNKAEAPDRIVRNLLSKLKFKCKNNCGVEFKYEDLKEHYLTKCPVEKVKVKPFIFQEINIQDVINQDYLKEILEEVTCSICLNVVFHPYTCSKCFHSFCFRCLDKNKENSSKCPCCKARTIEVETNRALSIILSKIKFKCVNGCDKEISYDDLEEHYLSKCTAMSLAVKKEEDQKNQPFTSPAQPFDNKNNFGNESTGFMSSNRSMGMNMNPFGNPFVNPFKANVEPRVIAFPGGNKSGY